MQLDIFSQDNLQLNQAYEGLLELDFETAIHHYQSVLRQNPDNQQAQEGQEVARHWKDLLIAYGSPSNPRECARLYQHIQEDLPVRKDWLSFGRSLLAYLAGAMEEVGIFELSSRLNRADLHLSCNQPARAEHSLAGLPERYRSSASYLLSLAEAQYRQNKLNQAHRHYLQAFWSEPDPELILKISRPEIQALIREVGFRWAPFYGWVRKLLPLLRPEDLDPPGPYSSEKVLSAYRLLYQCEVQRRKRGAKLIETRKRWKEKVPDPLFQEYIQRVQKEEKQLRL